MIHSLAAACLLILADSGASKDGYTLFHPTPPEFMRELSTDRPDTTESPYTVDAGHLQFEMSFLDSSQDRNGRSGSQTAFGVAPALLKVGLTNSIDLQLGFDPWTEVRERDGASGLETRSGFGDTVVRVKVNLLGNDSGDVAIAVMPSITIPTGSSGVGSDEIQGGIIVPVAFQMPAEFTFGVMAELDFVHDDDRGDHDAELLHSVTLSRAVVGDLGAFIEYAGVVPFEGEADYLASFNTGVTYALGRNAQLDAGARVGLSAAAEDLGLFVGLSLRH